MGRGANQRIGLEEPVMGVEVLVGVRVKVRVRVRNRVRVRGRIRVKVRVRFSPNPTLTRTHRLEAAERYGGRGGPRFQRGHKERRRRRRWRGGRKRGERARGGGEEEGEGGGGLVGRVAHLARVRARARVSFRIRVRVRGRGRARGRGRGSPPPAARPWQVGTLTRRWERVRAALSPRRAARVRERKESRHRRAWHTWLGFALGFGFGLGFGLAVGVGNRGRVGLAYQRLGRMSTGRRAA